MNKEDILKQLTQLNLPLDEYNICSSGSLVIRGIQKTAGDIDLQITEECFKNIKDSFEIYFVSNLEMFFQPNCIRSLYRFTKFDVEFFVVKKEELNYDYVEGYPCQKINDILEFKKKRNLPKDQISIKNILEYKKIIINDTTVYHFVVGKEEVK